MSDMLYRRCGSSGLLLPAISLGAWANLGATGAEDTARECMLRAFDLGITHFDLANNYGTPPGHAEEVCGRVLAELPRHEYVVASKAGYQMWDGPYGSGGSRKHLLASCDESLRRLGLDHLDILYSHRPDPDTPIEETIGALASLVHEGKALYVGISSYLGEQFDVAVGAAADAGVPITVTQPFYNLLWREIETELVARAESSGTGIVGFAPLASGLLTERYTDGRDPSGTRAAVWPGRWVRSHTDAQRIAVLRGLASVAADRGQSLPQMAIAWALRLPSMTSVVTGVSRPEQVDSSVAALDHLEFSPTELARIDDVLRSVS